MKRIYLMALVTILIVISSCNNQAKQQEIEKQRQEDSMRVAENVKKELAEKEAKEKAEREKQEAEERAAREAAERESKTWTGASSVPELRRKLIGTSWETTHEVLRYKATFFNDEVNMCITDLNGNRYKDENTYKYVVMSKGEYIVAGFGNEEEYENYQIGFVDSRAFLFINGHPLGELTFMGR